MQGINLSMHIFHIVQYWTNLYSENTSVTV